MNKNLYTKYAEWIIHESNYPISEIEFLIENLKTEIKEELEETIRTFIP